VDTISAINDVAMMLEDMGRIEEARAHAERAYEMNFRWQGPGHTETALMAHNLALTIMNEFPSDVLAAVPLLRLSLKTNEKIYGADNVDGTAYERKTLGQCLIQCVKLFRQRDSSKFHKRDRVKVIDDVKLNKRLAKGHGKWGPGMTACVGQMGTVKHVDSDGDVRVIFDPGLTRAGLNYGTKADFYFNPKALIADKDRPAAPSDLFQEQDSEKPASLTMAISPETRKKLGAISEEEAANIIEEETEAHLVSALLVCEGAIGDDDDAASWARECAKLLETLYKTHERKAEAKAMKKRQHAVEVWCSESDDSEEEDEPLWRTRLRSRFGGGATGSDSEEEGGVQDVLLEAAPRLARALQDDNDEQAMVRARPRRLSALSVSRRKPALYRGFVWAHRAPNDHFGGFRPGQVVDIEAAVAHLEEINRASPAETRAARKDRDKTGESLAKMLEVAQRRDRAAALLIPRAAESELEPEPEPEPEPAPEPAPEPEPEPEPESQSTKEDGL
jgi:hypothetical protein